MSEAPEPDDHGWLEAGDGHEVYWERCGTMRSDEMPAPAVRVARSSDEDALRAVERATWSWDVSPAPRRAPDKAFFPEHSGPQDTLVALVDGQIAGYAMLAPATGLESNRHVLEIHNLAVAPEHQRRGIGRVLIEAARTEALARGARRLRLRVLGPNIAAKEFYAACGFVVEGVLRGEFFLDGRFVDDILMALELVRRCPPRYDGELPR